MFVIRIFFIFSFILMIPSYVLGQSAISFDENGRWDCSFRASDFPVDLNQTDSIPIPGVFFYSSTWTTEACGDNQSGIYAYCNNEDGEGDRAFRYAVGDGINNNSTPLTIIMPAPYHPEIWIRFYIKWEEGFRWEYLTYQKIISFFTNGTMYKPMEMQWENAMNSYARILVNGSSTTIKGPGGGWRFMYGAPNPGENHPYSDGAWHVIEHYAKMNSAIGVYDGAQSIWVDGDLIVKETAVRWDGGDEKDLDGFRRFSLALNQRTPGNASGPLGRSCSYTYYDDIVIYNQTPPNVDAHGNPFIGPLSPAPPRGLDIKIIKE